MKNIVKMKGERRWRSHGVGGGGIMELVWFWWHTPPNMVHTCHTALHWVAYSTPLHMTLYSNGSYSTPLSGILHSITYDILYPMEWVEVELWCDNPIIPSSESGVIHLSHLIFTNSIISVHELSRHLNHTIIPPPPTPLGGGERSPVR